MKQYNLEKDNTAFILIDMQEKLLPAVKGAKKLFKPCQILLTACETFGLPLIVTEQYPRGLGITDPVLRQTAERLNAMMVEKIEFSAAVPEVIAYLKQKGIKTVLICGVEAHVCVFQSVRDLIAEGFQVQVAEDGIASRSAKNKHNAMRLMADLGAVISNSETMVFDLLKKAGTTEFKQISQVVK